MDCRLFLIGAAGLLATSGCSAVPTSGEKPGELGNGNFYFACDDAVSCAPYSNDAAKFPKSVSLGSTFTLRFVPNSGVDAAGVSIRPVGEYITSGPAGLAAMKAGYATVTSRDGAGNLIDYVSIRVDRPDALVVYAANDRATVPHALTDVTLHVGDNMTFRAFAQYKKAVLAGSLGIDWTADSRSFADLDTADGAAALTARSPGSVSLTAEGGTFKQVLKVTVLP
jgi:hypothetical protein